MPTRTETAPPVATILHTEKELHGHTLVDDYAWLRDRQNPEVTAYLEAENAYCNEILEPTQDLQKSLYDEMVSHIKETDVSVPFRQGDYWYYSRTEQGAQYPIYCRRQASSEAGDRFPGEAVPEEIILDINELARNESYMAVNALTVSDDGNLLAYAIDNKGFRQYTLQVKDLRTGQLLPDRVERTGSIVWAADSKTIFYTVEDEEQKRQFQFYRHTLGAPHAEDVLLFEETDERFNIGSGRTRDGKYLILESSSHTTTEEKFLSADDPLGDWRIIQPRQDDIEYYADHRHGLLYIRTNDAGRNFRLVTAPVDAPEQSN